MTERPTGRSALARRIGAAATAFLGVVAVSLLAACAPSAPQHASGEKEPARLHPTGDSGRWFDPAYAAGVGSTYSTSNRVCGVSDGWIVEFQSGPGITQRVLGRPLLPDAAVGWEIEQASCSTGSSFEGAVAVDLGPPERSTRALVSIETGTVAQKLPGKSLLSTATPISRAGGLIVLDAGEALVGADGERVAWRLPLTPQSKTVPLADGRIGVDDALGDRLSVVDGRTGTVLVERGYDKPFGLKWAGDGFVLNVNERDPEYAFSDVHGAEVERTTGSSQYGFVPSPSDGITFPIADHVAAGTVVGVDSSGRPALWQSEHQQNFTRKGPIDDLPDSIISLQAVSADGSLLLFDSPSDEADGIVVIDGTGKRVLEWRAPDATSRIDSGRIIVRSGSTTHVLIPEP